MAGCVLVLLDARCPREGDVGRELAERVRGRRVLVVAPALASRLSVWMDEDIGREAAGERLSEALAQLDVRGLDATGEVGDADPLQALDDAIRLQPVEEIVIVTDEASDERWLEKDLPDRAGARFGLRVSHLTTGRVETTVGRHDRLVKSALVLVGLGLAALSIAVIVGASAGLPSWVGAVGLVLAIVILNVGVKIAFVGGIWYAIRRRERHRPNPPS